MSGKCKICGKKLHAKITHCSNQCLFASLGDSISISGTPIETWDDWESNPWK